MKIVSAATVKIYVTAFVPLLVFLVIAFNSIDLISVTASAGSYRTDGASVFARSCARCHGFDGRAQTAKGKQVDATDFTSGDWSPDTARDTRIVTNGKGSMPSFKRKLTPAEISSVVAYIRRFKN